MNKSILTILVCLCSVFGVSQVAINTTGASADESAVLDVSSTNSGFIPPVMSASQRIAISTPAEGLLVFDTDSLALFYYNGSSWKGITQSVQTAVEVGDVYLGGVVGYVYWDSIGEQHGFVVAQTDLDPSDDDQWQTLGTTTNATSLYDGKTNTATIATSNNTWMAQVDTANGWYIPSILEFRLLYSNIYIVNKALEENGYTTISAWRPYWSSTEYDGSSAWYLERNELQIKTGSKTSYKYFRAIKSF